MKKIRIKKLSGRNTDNCRVPLLLGTLIMLWVFKKSALLLKSGYLEPSVSFSSLKIGIFSFLRPFQFLLLISLPPKKKKCPDVLEHVFLSIRTCFAPLGDHRTGVGCAQ